MMEEKDKFTLQEVLGYSLGSGLLFGGVATAVGLAIGLDNATPKANKPSSFGTEFDLGSIFNVFSV
jgi:hypothetical protein